MTHCPVQKFVNCFFLYKAVIDLHYTVDYSIQIILYMYVYKYCNILLLIFNVDD